MASEINQLSNSPITAHSFSLDRSLLAVCENSNEAKIYRKGSGSSWNLTDTLNEHDKVITSIDWAPHSNRIVTASQDRNAYVWQYGPDPLNPDGSHVWQPTLVLLRINRSATFVRWSPDEAKFAVGSGARAIAVCQYDAESNWWVAKHLKKPLRSTVLSVAWHPNSVLLAAGSADATCRVLSAYIKGVDSKPEPTVWGERIPFNTICGDFSSPAGGWVHDVSFSPSGDALAFVSHDSTVTIVYPSAPDAPPSAVHVIKLPSLPLVSLTFCGEDTFVAAGHDCQPLVFQGDSNRGWKLVKTLEEFKGVGSPQQQRTPSGGIGRLNNDAFNLFRSADSRGVMTAAGEGGSNGGSRAGLETVHSNTITSVRKFAGADGSISHISTSGSDGKVVIWDISAGGVTGIAKGVASIRI
ncbi:WD40-repeat-containing domain protein [Phakopsora pachyrhizi]|nr:WD40-repeat-containing domain protein [Phakopsora pachyrhizi]